MHMTQNWNKFLLQNLQYLIVIVLFTTVIFGYTLGLRVVLDLFAVGTMGFGLVIAAGILGFAVIAYGTACLMKPIGIPEYPSSESDVKKEDTDGD